MDIRGNISYICAISGVWIFDANFNNSLTLKIEILYYICPSSGSIPVTLKYDQVFHAVQFIPHNKIKITYNNLITYSIYRV